MSLSEVVRKNQAVVAIAATLVIVVSVYMIVRPKPGARPTQAVYFYDLSTGQLFNQPRATLPPVKAPSGGAEDGVQAHVFSCGACGGTEQYIGYLITMPATVKQTLAAPKPGINPVLLIGSNEKVAEPPKAGVAIKWLPRHSPEGEQLVSAAERRCNGQLAKLCNP